MVTWTGITCWITSFSSSLWHWCMPKVRTNPFPLNTHLHVIINQVLNWKWMWILFCFFPLYTCVLLPLDRLLNINLMLNIGRCSPCLEYLWLVTCLSYYTYVEGGKTICCSTFSLHLVVVCASQTRTTFWCYGKVDWVGFHCVVFSAAFLQYTVEINVFRAKYRLVGQSKSVVCSINQSIWLFFVCK